MIHSFRVLRRRLVREANSCVYGRQEVPSLGAVFEQFAEELKAWEAEYAGRPRDELIGLCLLALEREELVSVGYREELMTRRLSAMPISSAIRELMRHALVWSWRDEEMHSIYSRGALLKYGGPFFPIGEVGQSAGGLGRR